jgi:hypothetical protein
MQHPTLGEDRSEIVERKHRLTPAKRGARVDRAHRGMGMRAALNAACRTPASTMSSMNRPLPGQRAVRDEGMRARSIHRITIAPRFAERPQSAIALAALAMTSLGVA